MYCADNIAIYMINQIKENGRRCTRAPKRPEALSYAMLDDDVIIIDKPDPFFDFFLWFRDDCFWQ
jgi:hypothetical protein